MYCGVYNKKARMVRALYLSFWRFRRYVWVCSPRRLLPWIESFITNLIFYPHFGYYVIMKSPVYKVPRFTFQIIICTIFTVTEPNSVFLLWSPSYALSSKFIYLIFSQLCHDLLPTKNLPNLY